MKKGALTLRLFIGYQIDSTFHAPSDFQKLGEILAKLLNKGAPSIDAEISYGEFPAGVELWAEVLSQIRLCDVAIFDISENNPNVLLEAGLAYGMRKLVILLKSKKACVKTPTDVNAFVYLPYKFSNVLHSKENANSIEQAIRERLNKGNEYLFYFRQLWSLDPKTHTYVLPGTLPSSIASNQFEDFIRLRNYTDLDAVFLVAETITRMYPEMKVSVLSASSTDKLPDDWGDSNLVLIGGPDFNVLVKEFDDCCPIKYMYSGKDKVWLHHKKTGREYIPIFKGKGAARIAYDHGFFLKMPLNKHGRGKLVIIGGARTWGVYGAARLVSCRGFLDETNSSKSVRKIVEKLGSDPSFLVTVQVKGTTAGVHPPTFDFTDIEPIKDETLNANSFPQRHHHYAQADVRRMRKKKSKYK